MFPRRATMVSGEFRDADAAMSAVNPLVQSFGAQRVRVNRSGALIDGGLAVEVAAGRMGSAATSLLRSNGAIEVRTRNTNLGRLTW